MGTVAPFRIKGGLDLDGKVQFQVFPSAPSGFMADSLSVGSLGIAQDSGQWYRKTTIGAGPDKWAALTTSMDLIGIAPTWLQPVDAVETRSLSLNAARSWMNEKGIVGGVQLPGNAVKRVLYTHTVGAPPGIFETGFYPQASVRMDPEGANPPGSHVYTLRSSLPTTAETTAGNALTFVATTNNPTDATETTCTITSNAIAVNLKNTAGASTAKMIEVIRAVEATDTNNIVYFTCPNFTAEEISSGIDTTTPMPPMALISFTGGSDGSGSADVTEWTLGTLGQGLMHFFSSDVGRWNDFSIVTTTNAMDGVGTTSLVVDEVAKTFTIHLANNGTAITATVGDVINAVSAPTFSTFYGQAYSGPLLAFDSDPAQSDADDVLITEECNETGTQGIAASWGFERVALRTVKGVTRQNHVGDTVYVADGFEKGSVYVFNDDGVWVKQGQSSTLESGFIQTFIGKSGDGSELPTYSSTDVVTQAANLETAIGQLDAATGDALAFMGKAIGEEMPLYADPVAVTQGASLNDGISQLDREVGYLLSFIGKGVGNEAPAYLTTKIVGQGTSLETAISALDDRLGLVSRESSATAVTSQVTADSILMEQELAAEWIIHAREVAHPGNVYVTRVVAAHNASIGVAATAATFNESAIIELGKPINGFEITMDVEVSGALNVRTMRLRMASAVPVDVTMNRAVLRRVA
ncbi:MAG: hypothetical protein HQL95_00730 [Magnetococcales bacterium]|nr:hypothetical protein [Magnetococcales bacterium]